MLRTAREVEVASLHFFFCVLRATVRSGLRSSAYERSAPSSLRNGLRGSVRCSLKPRAKPPRAKRAGSPRPRDPPGAPRETSVHSAGGTSAAHRLVRPPSLSQSARTKPTARAKPKPGAGENAEGLTRTTNSSRRRHRPRQQHSRHARRRRRKKRRQRSCTQSFESHAASSQARSLRGSKIRAIRSGTWKRATPASPTDLTDKARGRHYNSFHTANGSLKRSADV